MIKVIAIGKKHESWVAEGIERYQKRLKPPFDIEWVLLPHSTLNGTQARENESQAIMAKLSQSDYVILLDERGGMYDSPALAQKLNNLFSNSQNVVLVMTVHVANLIQTVHVVKMANAVANSMTNWISSEIKNKNRPFAGFYLSFFL